MRLFDYLIVGAGFTGATFARLLTDHGFRVVVLERRPVVGGNCADTVHRSGIRYHIYGPHLFRTSSTKVWNFVQRFAQFYCYEHTVQTLVNGKVERWPLTQSYLIKRFGQNWAPGFTGTPRNFEEASLRMMPRKVYDEFIREYTIKQWGVDPTELEASVAGRFAVRDADDPRFSTKRFQGLPAAGYSAMIENMLRGIEVITNCDYEQFVANNAPRQKVIYTGPIDEFFKYRLGKLRYRTQHRAHTYLEEFDSNCYLTAPVLNNPSIASGAHVRTVEWKQMLPEAQRAQVHGTLVTIETPGESSSPEEHEYPFPDSANQDLYQRYVALAQEHPNVLFCGRLGEYRYLDMDQAIARAMMLAERERREHLRNCPDFKDAAACAGAPE